MLVAGAHCLCTSFASSTFPGLRVAARYQAWRRVDLLLPLVTDLFACPVPSVAFRVEPFLSLFCNKTKLQLHLPSCPMANTPGIPSALVCACPSPKLGGAERQGAVCDFVAPQDLSPFLSSLLQLVYQKVSGRTRTVSCPGDFRAEGSKRRSAVTSRFREVQDRVG